MRHWPYTQVVTCWTLASRLKLPNALQPLWKAWRGFPEISHATVPYLVAFSYHLFWHSLKILLRLLANNIKLFKQLLSILIRSTLGVFLTLLKNKIIEGNVLKVAKNGHFLKNRRQARNIVKSSHFGDKSPQMATLDLSDGDRLAAAR